MRLTAADASFLYVETAGGPTHISTIFTLEGELDFERVVEHFEARIHLVPAYRRRLAQVPLNIAHPEWVDDPEFDLRNHLHHVELPEGSSPQDGIDKAIEMNEPLLDRSRPLWGLWMISGVPDRTYILQSTHHSMVDGASGVELIAMLLDFSPDGRNIEPAQDAWRPAPLPDAMTLFSNGLRDNAEAFENADWARMMSASAEQRDMMTRAGTLMNGFLTRPVVTAPFNAGLISQKRRYRVTRISYDDMREVRQGLGGTVNDVALTVVSEAVARYLRHHREFIDGQHMRIMCPVNVRTEAEEGALGNRVSGVFPVLPAWPMAPTERLAAVAAEMNGIKEAQSAQVLAQLQENAPPVWPLAMLPTQLVGSPQDPTAAVAQLGTPLPLRGVPRPPNVGINFVCTNVPGVQVQQYLCGQPVLEQTGVLCLVGNSGLGVTILSYNRMFYFGFISEPRLLPDVEYMADAAESVFTELLDEARARQREQEQAQAENQE